MKTKEMKRVLITTNTQAPFLNKNLVDEGHVPMPSSRAEFFGPGFFFVSTRTRPKNRSPHGLVQNNIDGHRSGFKFQRVEARRVWADTT
jgi:hypothetical protein